MIRHYNIFIKGRVQGVSYRFTAQAKAHEFDLTGFVRNQHDGSVYAEVEGEENNINRFIDWCNVGPTRSVVTEVRAEEGEVKGYQTFEIKK